MSILNTTIKGVRAGQPHHLILEFNTTFLAEGAIVDFSIVVNGNAPIGQSINLTPTVPSQKISYGGVDGTLSLENNSYVVFKGSANWAHQIEVVSEGGIIVAMK